MLKSMRRSLVRTGRVAVAAAAALAPVTLADAAGPYSFFSLAPCRVVDTRNAAGATGGPALAANSRRDFPILGACGVPSTAQAVAFNVTVVSPTDFGDIRMFPAGTAMPLASVINWVGSDWAVANGAIIPVGASGGNHVSVWVDMPAGSTGTVHLILDVTGYFE